MPAKSAGKSATVLGASFWGGALGVLGTAIWVDSQPLQLGAATTVVGEVVFDEKGDLKNASYDINQWHDGKYAPIQP